MSVTKQELEYLARTLRTNANSRKEIDASEQILTRILKELKLTKEELNTLKNHYADLENGFRLFQQDIVQALRESL